MLELNIDPKMSVYNIVKRIKNERGTMNHRKTMTFISHEIEDSTLVDGANTVIFSSFQTMSKFLPQQKRYRRMAQKAEHIYVFGLPDVDVPEIPKITYISLKPTDQLVKEWFLVSCGRDFASALATEEQTHFTDPDDLRVFEGVWTFDIALVHILYEWLAQSVDLRNTLPQDLHNLQRQREFMLKISSRLTERVAQTDNTSLQMELAHLLQNAVTPALNNIG